MRVGSAGAAGLGMGRARRMVRWGARTAWVGVVCPGPGCMRHTAQRFVCTRWGVAGYYLSSAPQHINRMQTLDELLDMG